MFGLSSAAMAGLSEIAWQVGSIVRATGWAAAAVGAAVVLGLWFPRQLLRYQFARRATPPVHGNLVGTSQISELDFATSIAGGLIFTVAIFVLMLVIAAGSAEYARAFLIERFVLPGRLIVSILCAPLYLILTLTMLVGTIALISVHGWYRCITAPRTHVAYLWLGFLPAIILAGCLREAFGAATPVLLAAPVALFVASALATLTARAQALPYQDAIRFRQVNANERGPLALIALAALCAGVAAGQAVFSATLSIGISVATMGAGATVGLLLARFALRHATHDGFGPATLLGCAVALGLIGGAGNAQVAFAALLLLASSASACVVFNARSISRACGSLQYALSVVGGLVFGGLCLGLATSAMLHQTIPATALLIGVSLACAATAGIRMILIDERPALGVRIGGFVAATTWVLILPWVGAGNAVESDKARATAVPQITNLGRAMFESPGLRVRYVPGKTGDAGVAPKQIDLDVHAADVIVFTLDASLDARTIRRAARSLARGGRLVLEMPSDNLATLRRHTFPASTPRYHFVLRNGDQTYDAVLFGNDVPAWIGRQTAPHGYELSLYRPHVSARGRAGMTAEP